MPAVLIIDDDIALLNACRVGLQALGHDVSTAETGGEGLSSVALRRPDVIVLDLGLPDLDGMDVCARVRGWTDTPIVILSADGAEDRKVEALDGGADDYMTKPFGMRELDARLRVALRHHHNAGAGNDHGSQLEVGALVLDLQHCEATFHGASLDLTPKEFDFLAYLARHVGKVCTRRLIMEHVWGPAYANETHYLKVYAYRIRKKLGDEQGRFLQTDPSVGYRLKATDI
ncbi:two-component system response regulator KdpE [Planotetraspora phitsanulokensis]|uniref:DNA-binding response regulator n=1 Tax=Planotetraspora phitsanulokensis TaxID=575192 RepID=A0A8J3TYM8_9ACTN|nr:response regulator transcription factor [Planotetraspora phitsanulokensis]GII35125.1 DNA-binding response regulator [Planotetraspora phitsanulokensis]